MAAICGGSVIFMVLVDLATYGILGYYFFLNWNYGMVLFLMGSLSQ